jgi:hypothetical protein
MSNSPLETLEWADKEMEEHATEIQKIVLKPSQARSTSLCIQDTFK